MANDIGLSLKTYNRYETQDAQPSIDMLKRLALKLGVSIDILTGFEMDYFRAMVRYGQADTEEKKKAAYEDMLAVAKQYKVRVLSGDLFEYYDSWRNPVLRELAPLMPGATPGELAKKIYVETSAQEVRESLDFLTKAGLLKKNDDGMLAQSEASVKGAPDATRLALRGMHRQMSELAAPALDLPKEERNFSGVTMGVSRETYARIVDVLDECRKKIIAIAAEDKNIDQVYRLNLQLFPLTRNIRENENA